MTRIDTEQSPAARRLTMSDTWWHWLAGMVMAALVAYFTTTSAIQAEVAAMKATEASHFEEVLRRLDAMSIDIRELRNREP